MIESWDDLSEDRDVEAELRRYDESVRSYSVSSHNFAIIVTVYQ